MRGRPSRTPQAASYRGPERRRFVNRSWPLPAFVAWAACWLVFAITREPIRIAEGLSAYLAERGLESLADIIGKANVGFTSAVSGDEG